MSLYRLYIDESGHHRYQLAGSMKERYLGLCGVIINLDEYKREVEPRMEAMRALFYTDPDEKPPFHLEDIMRRKNAFACLRDSSIQAQFNDLLLSLYTEVDYRIVTVVIDKTRHYNQYVTPEHPYHYSIACMLERYYKFLNAYGGQGDVMAEARGGKEDAKLKQVYELFYERGTQYVSPSQIRSRFTAHEIKIKTKHYLVHGLELADLLALATKLDVLHTYGQIPDLASNFTKTIIEKIQPKYYRGPAGVKGNGKKFL